MKILRLFDSLKFVVVAIVCTFILNVAHADTTAIQSVIAYGKTEQSGTPTPTNPVPIMTNNGVLTASKNLFDDSLFDTASAGIGYHSFSIPNGTYTMSTNFPATPAGITNVFIFAGRVSSGASSPNNGVSANVPRTITVTNGYYTVAYRSGGSGAGNNNDPKNFNWMLSNGSTATAYEPYGGIVANGLTETIRDAAGHKATTQMLLGLNDQYRDEQNINTGAITRKVGVKVLNGTENWEYSVALLSYMYSLRIDDLYAESSNVTSGRKTPYCTHFERSEQWITSSDAARNNIVQAYQPGSGSAAIGLGYNYPSAAGLDDFKAWLAEQYAAGTPVIIVYPLATETTENVATQTLTTAPVRQTLGAIMNMPIKTILTDNTEIMSGANELIKIATTKYNEESFEDVQDALTGVFNAVDTVVTQTMTQAQAIDTIATSKQTRPNEGCDAKYCLLVEDEDGTPHWYPIAGANGVAHNLPAGYTELQYLQTDGNSWIDTGIKGDMSYKYEIDFQQLDARQYRNWGAFDQSGFSGGPNMSLTYATGFAVRWTVSGSASQVLSNFSSLDSNRHHIIIDNGYVTWDGVNKGRSTGHQDNYVFGYNLFLGTVNPGGNTPTSNAKSKYYSYKVWNTSGELIQDLIPVKNSSGVVGMYDMVSGTFFTNAGTGTFTAGPDM